MSSRDFVDKWRLVEKYRRKSGNSLRVHRFSLEKGWAAAPSKEEAGTLINCVMTIQYVNNMGWREVLALCFRKFDYEHKMREHKAKPFIVRLCILSLFQIFSQLFHGTAAAIYDMRRLQYRRCGELALRALLAPTIASRVCV